MLRILVANRAGRRMLDHDRGPLELWCGPRREAPRLALDDSVASNNQLAVEEVDGGGPRRISVGGINPHGQAADSKHPLEHPLSRS
jgi:hypothetical protein